MIELLPYKLAVALLLYNRGWMSVTRISMLHLERFGYSGDGSIQTTLRRMERERMVKKRGEARVGAGNARCMWALSGKGVRVVGQILETMPSFKT